jgi:hypothetical protein
MGIAKTARAAGGSPLGPGVPSGGADSRGSLDAASRGRVQIVCDFVNAEVAYWRNLLIGVSLVSLVGMVLFPLVTGLADARVAIVIVAGIVAVFFARARHELASSYGRLATKRLVAATNKALSYKPLSSLTREQFVALDLFPLPGTGWRGVHEIGGRAGNASFSLHAVHAPAMERGRDVFRGVIIRLDFATSFPHTVVLPERQGHGTGTSGSTARRDLVLVKNPEFERMFNPYSADYLQARQLFTETFMQLVISATRLFGPDLRFAFLKRSLFVAVPGATLLPEVSLVSAPLTAEAATGQLARLAALAEALAGVVGTQR